MNKWTYIVPPASPKVHDAFTRYTRLSIISGLCAGMSLASYLRYSEKPWFLFWKTFDEEGKKDPEKQKWMEKKYKEFVLFNERYGPPLHSVRRYYESQFLPYSLGSLVGAVAGLTKVMNWTSYVGNNKLAHVIISSFVVGSIFSITLPPLQLGLIGNSIFTEAERKFVIYLQETQDEDESKELSPDEIRYRLRCERPNFF